MDYLWIIALLVLGVLMIIRPTLLWRIEHLFTVKNGEPTELYLTLMRVGGVFFFFVAAIVCAAVTLL